MKVVFADTYYYLALTSRSDAGHSRAVAFSHAYHGRVLTTPWVLTEVGDALASTDLRRLFIALLHDVKRDVHVTVVDPANELFEEGCKLYSERADKSWTLTDCISFVVMERHRVVDALTADHHFEQAGFKALLR